ncbi:hypothetical protein ES708_18050 [subsurface metagenome]
MMKMKSLRQILNSTKRFIGTSLLVGALTVNFLTENVQSQDLESKVAAVSAQTAPEVEWDKTFGGPDNDSAYSVQQTSDKGYIVAGNIDREGNSDFWLIKTDSNGNKEWDKTFGDSDRDYARSVQQTSDGGYILAGYTQSFGAGGYDFWLIKTDLNGNKEWDKTFGGSESDKAYSVQQTLDEGYIVAGYTHSFGAGHSDFWLIKTDQNGNKVWDKTFGGSDNDYAYSVQQTSDKGYILAGDTKSFGAGGYDFWLIKTDQNGNKKWDKTFGGSNDDWTYSVQQTSDKGYILAGHTKSFGAGNSDFWLIKTDSNGNKEWDKTFGGPEYDFALSVQQTSDKGYILAGHTQSFGAGNYDAWLIKTDQKGNELWDKTFGGSKSDYAHSVQQTSDGGYILAGYTQSFGAGGRDLWLVKLKGNGVMVEEDQPKADSLLQNYPNPFNEATTIQYNLPENSKVSLDIYNLSGQKVKTLVDKVQEPGNYIVNFNANNLPSGIYFSRLKTQHGIKTEKMMLVK